MKKHGEVQQVEGRRVSSPEYRAWQSMKNRCYNTRSADYPYYGARGITVCKKWQTSFPAFLEDVGRRPSVLHTLDRIKTGRGYSPSNCRWATREVQSRNRPYAKTKIWVLAEALGVNTVSARNSLARVRAKDRGCVWASISPEREAVVRAHMQKAKI
jgi:hypothetical protein